MTKLSLLLLAGAVTPRRTLARALDAEACVGALATAATAAIALAKVPRLNPDVVLVVLGPDTPEALGWIAEVRASYPLLPIVAHWAAGAGLAEKLMTDAGASWCVERPAVLTEDALAAHVRDRLAPALAAAVRTAPARSTASRAGSPGTVGTSPVEARARSEARTMEVLALGASTGGPEALETVLSRLPVDFGLPIVVVQHMPADFTTRFARRLATRCRLAVGEATHGERLRPGRVLLAPGGQHLRVRRVRDGVVAQLDDGVPENYCRPSVDVLFRSVAQVYGKRALAVVLTGMGADGARGAAELVAAGAEVLAQDEDSSTVWGMPGAVSRAGLASAILPLSEVAPAILARTRRPRRPQDRP